MEVNEKVYTLSGQKAKISVRKYIDDIYYLLSLLDEAKRALEKLPNMDGSHFVNIIVRRNGKNEVYEADYLKTLTQIKEGKGDKDDED